MRGAVLYGPRDVRFEEREVPKIMKPTDAIVRISATCVCGSDLWPYRGISAVPQPTPMGHEYCGIIEKVGSGSSRLSLASSSSVHSLLPTTPVPTVRSDISHLARTASSSAPHRLRCCASRLRTARL